MTTAENVIPRYFDVRHGDCRLELPKMDSRSVDLVIGSPPYAEKGERYGSRRAWKTEDWVPWMVAITKQAVRVASNVVIWVVNGSVRDGRYLPACELLLADCFRAGLRCERPAIWHKNAPPNRRDWFGNDWEYCLAFRPEDSTGYFDWQAIAEPPKYSSGGKFRQRTSNGTRRLGSEYPTNKLTRPRDVLRVTVGGGHLGSKLAHENEAPFPEGIVRPFIATCCPPGGTVLDPFCGSGTTLAVAIALGRNAIGIDERESQIELTGRRVKESRHQ